MRTYFDNVDRFKSKSVYLCVLECKVVVYRHENTNALVVFRKAPIFCELLKLAIYLK